MISVTMVNGRLSRCQPGFGGVAAPPGSAELKRCVGRPASSNSIFGRSLLETESFPGGSGGKREGLSHGCGPHSPLWQPVHTWLYWSLAHVACENNSQWPPGVRMIWGLVCDEPSAMSESLNGPTGWGATACTTSDCLSHEPTNRANGNKEVAPRHARHWC